MSIKKTLLLIIFQLIICECFASPFDSVVLDDSILNSVDEEENNEEEIEEKTVEVAEVAETTEKEPSERKYKIFNSAELIFLDRLTGQKTIYKANELIKVEKCYHYDDANYRNVDFVEVLVDGQKEIISNNNSIKSIVTGEDNKYLVFLKGCF